MMTPVFIAPLPISKQTQVFSTFPLPASASYVRFYPHSFCIQTFPLPNLPAPTSNLPQGLRKQSLAPQRHNRHRKHHSRRPHRNNVRRASTRRPPRHTSSPLLILVTEPFIRRQPFCQREIRSTDSHQHRKMHHRLHRLRSQTALPHLTRRSNILSHEDWRPRLHWPLVHHLRNQHLKPRPHWR
jgi:hypothetical protein